ncbi:hypothetical protein RND81_05G128400 [Saponaria officinalis]|uniref:BED-type domain-containing protein n=1 Tax=Saponaria officinalis TaxID=3572 RepID=A0AAW1KXJ5_SAPOF
MGDENVNSCTRPSGGENGFEASSHPHTIDLESPCETESDPSIIPLTSRHTSEAWKHYKRKRVGDDIKAECNYCQKYLAGGPRAGTSHLKDHTKCCPKRICKDLRQTRLFGTQVNPVDKSETLTLAPYEFHQDHGRHDLAEMIILHEYPLSMVEHYGFRKFCKTMQPGFKVPCRNTTRKDIMTRYGVEKGIMSSLLEKTKDGLTVIGESIERVGKSIERFAKYSEVENQGGEKSELEKYLEAQKVPIKTNAPDNFDILTWWKTNGSTYPILQMIARDILGIPASSVASESAFSTGGRVLSPYRSRLLPSIVEALICARNWIWTNIKGCGEFKEVEYEELIEEMEEVENITDDEV